MKVYSVQYTVHQMHHKEKIIKTVKKYIETKKGTLVTIKFTPVFLINIILTNNTGSHTKVYLSCVIDIFTNSPYFNFLFISSKLNRRRQLYKQN